MKNIKKTILIVEDDIPLQKVIKNKLEASGFEILTARSVDEACEHVKNKEKISFIWLDHYLVGKENGFDFVVKLKQNKNYKKIPIFLVSNNADHDEVRSYLELGVNKYFAKFNSNLSEIIEHMKKVI